MKKISRLLSILIITMMIASPFMSFATEEWSSDASGGGSEVISSEAANNGDGATEEEAATKNTITDDMESAEQEEKAATTYSKDNEDKDAIDTQKDPDKFPDEPTEVTVVDSVVELSEESDATYDNDAFFTIDAAKDDSADLATEEVSENVTDILSGDGSAAEKQNEIIDALEVSGLYRAEESGKSKVDVTSKFAYQRLRLIASQENEINAYGASKAVFFEGSYLLSYDSIETTMHAYDALVAEHGSDAVFIDTPMKLSAGEKGWGTAYMRMNYQKTLENNSGEVTVAVVDSGIQKTHPVFSGTTILQGRDFVNNDNDPADDEGHGTAVSGVIAESTPANVKILPLKAMDAKGEGSEFDVISAVRYAEEQGADIINLSIGGYMDSNSEMENYDAEFSRYNALIVCASGNENQNMDAQGVYEFPGELKSTICVGAITVGKARSSFSNYGQAVDFAAPGSSIMIAKPGGSYGYDSGTSFASPYIAAAAATVKAGHTDYSKAQMINDLKTISEDLGAAGKDVYFGNGCPRFPADPDHQSGGNLSDQDLDTSVTGIQNKTYNGSEQTQDPCVIVNGEVLEKGTDFDVRYQNNVNAGTANMTIIGKGDYSGEIGGITFTIYPKSITPSVSLSGTSFTYTGKEVRPEVTVRDGGKVLVSGTDYTVSYSSNANVGTGYAKVTCKGNYRGSSTASFKIVSNSSYTLEAVSVTNATVSTAVLNWRCSHALSGDARIDINGHRVTPTINKDGSYSFMINGCSPASAYKVPVKIVDSRGRVLSNTITFTVRTPYIIQADRVTNVTLESAVVNWKSSHQLNGDAMADINGHRVKPTVNEDGSYSFRVNGCSPASAYRVPVKIVNSKGKTLSNTIYFTIRTPYIIQMYRVSNVTQESAVIYWKSSHQLIDGAKADINGHRVTPSLNKDGSYSFRINGCRPASVYKIPVKLVSSKGKILSNTIYFTVRTP